MTAAEFLAQAQAAGAEIALVRGKLATRGLRPEMRDELGRHKMALLYLLAPRCWHPGTDDVTWLPSQARWVGVTSPRLSESTREAATQAVRPWCLMSPRQGDERDEE